jgi:RimJ/RimL family protein N-acetyltransferase
MPVRCPDLRSYSGQSKTREDSRNAVLRKMPVCEFEGDPRRYSTPFLVYEQVGSGSKGRVVGYVTIAPLQTYGIQFADHLVPPDADAAEKGVLKMELGYLFLHEVWGRGYATEAVTAVLAMLKAAPGHWHSYHAVYFHGVVRPANKASCRVMEKIGFREVGEHVWSGPMKRGGEERENRAVVFADEFALPDADPLLRFETRG